jgi:hypothetical protein
MRCEDRSGTGICRVPYQCWMVHPGTLLAPGSPSASQSTAAPVPDSALSHLASCVDVVSASVLRRSVDRCGRAGHARLIHENERLDTVRRVHTVRLRQNRAIRAQLPHQNCRSDVASKENLAVCLSDVTPRSFSHSSGDSAPRADRRRRRVCARIEHGNIR